jgi:diaminopimelate decarboxylase
VAGRAGVTESLLPLTYRVNPLGHMEIGGCDLVELAGSYGTPLYVYDEETIRKRCHEFVAAMAERGQVLYSAKAFASPGFIRLVAQEGLGLDVVSAGELHIALRSGFAPDRIHFLGNNKSLEDVEAAYQARTTLVIDGFHDLDLIRQIVPTGSRFRCYVRVSPGVRPDTHDFISTGQLDSKFGFSIESGAARKVVELALADERIELAGLHSHIGSQLLDLHAHVAAIRILLNLVADLRRDLSWAPQCLDMGGGLGIGYRWADDPPTPSQFVQTLLRELDEGCRQRDLTVPSLIVEPGRSIAGPAGVALYRVGSIKDVPGVRKYVAVDGGMGDNIRPKLYGAQYEVILASDPARPAASKVTIAGKYCESTDVLAQDVSLPELTPGDILCLPAAGAYCLEMASNYNRMPRPAVIMVRDGQVSLIRRRETLDDLLRFEIF